MRPDKSPDSELKPTIQIPAKIGGPRPSPASGDSFPCRFFGLHFHPRRHRFSLLSVLQTPRRKGRRPRTNRHRWTATNHQWQPPPLQRHHPPPSSAVLSTSTPPSLSTFTPFSNPFPAPSSKP